MHLAELKLKTNLREQREIMFSVLCLKRVCSHFQKIKDWLRLKEQYTDLEGQSSSVLLSGHTYNLRHSLDMNMSE